MRLTPHNAPRLVFLPLSFGLFVAGMLTAAAIFFRNRPFVPAAMVLSTLESSFANPHGFRFAAAAIILSALLLLPIIVRWNIDLRSAHRVLVPAAGVFCLLAITAAVAIGLNPPRADAFSPFHVQLAFAAFGFLCAGTLLFLVAAHAPLWMRCWQSAALFCIVWIYLFPQTAPALLALDHVALLEWGFCANCAAATWLLAWHIERFGARWTRAPFA